MYGGESCLTWAPGPKNGPNPGHDHPGRQSAGSTAGKRVTREENRRGGGGR